MMNTCTQPFLLSLLGAPYTAWAPHMNVLEDAGAPFFTSASVPPSTETLHKEGTNCAGLMNIVRLLHGQSPLGGTPHWEAALKGVLRPFNRSQSYPAGTLCMRRYRTDYEDEGHVGMIWGGTGPALQQPFFHSWRGMGITLDDALATSDAWDPEGYYELVCLPEDWLLTS